MGKFCNDHPVIALIGFVLTVGLLTGSIVWDDIRVVLDRALYMSAITCK